MNLDVPPKKTRTMAGVTYTNQAGEKYTNDPTKGPEIRAALVRALSERPGANVRELCVMIGRSSTSTVQHHLYKLEEEGRIVRDSCPLCRAKIWRVA